MPGIVLDILREIPDRSFAGKGADRTSGQIVLWARDGHRATVWRLPVQARRAPEEISLPSFFPSSSFINLYWENS